MKCKKIIGAALALILVILSAAPALAEDKKETVFLTTNGSGDVIRTVVSEHLYNPDHRSELTDRTALNGFEILSGADSYTEKDGMLLWHSDGSDVRYEGETDRQAPVGFSLSFTLDGKPVDAADLKGKSGHLTMTIDYTANEMTEIPDGDETRTAPIPFLMLSGMILNMDHFSNIQVTNGKVVDAGNLTMLVMWGLPGMTEALGLTDYITEFNDILDKDYSVPEFPESAVLECDVTDLSLSDLYTVAMNASLNDIDTDELLPFDLDEADDESWSDKVSEILDKLTDAADELKDGAQQLADGAGELSDGLNTIDENSKALTDGAREIFQGILDTANDTLAESESSFKMLGITLRTLTIENFDEELDRLMTEMLANVEGVVYETAERKLRNAVNQAVHAEVVRQVTAAAEGMVAEEVEKVVSAKVRAEVEAAARAKIIAAINDMDEETLNAEVEKRMQTPEIQAQINDMIDQQLKTPEVQAMIDAQLEAQIRPQVEAAVRQQVTDAVRAGVVNEVTAAVRAEVRAQVIGSLTKPEPEETEAPEATAEPVAFLPRVFSFLFAPAAAAEELTEEEIEAIVDQQMATDAVQSRIHALVEQNMASAEVQSMIDAQYNAPSTQAALEATVAAQKEANRSAAEAQAAVQVRAQVEAGARQKIIDTITNMDEATLNAIVAEKMQSPEIQAQMNAAYEEQMASDYVQGLIAQNIAAQLAGSDVQAKIDQNVKEQMASANVKKIIEENIKEQRHGSTYLNGIAEAMAENGKDGKAYRSLADLKDTLDNVNTFYKGVIDYTDAVGTAKDGAAELADGAAELSDGVNTLTDKLDDFCDGDGEKLLDLLESSIVHLPDAADGVFDAMRGYTSFCGIADGMTGSTRFIFHTTF